MCLILFAHNVHPDYPLVLAANRDEFYARPTDAAGFWKAHPELLAGRDLEAGGTWLGMSRGGRFAAITNFREGERSDTQKSRGQLTLDYLLSRVPPQLYLQQLKGRADEYAGFNLLLGDEEGLHYYGNRVTEPRCLQDGIYALGNGTLYDDWHKMHKGKDDLAHAIDGKVRPEEVLQLMRDESRPEDAYLPDTGVDLELERLLSSRFIRSEHYGTRATTVLLIDRRGNVDFLEQNYTRQGASGAVRRFRFQLET